MFSFKAIITSLASLSILGIAATPTLAGFTDVVDANATIASGVHNLEFSTDGENWSTHDNELITERSNGGAFGRVSRYDPSINGDFFIRASPKNTQDAPLDSSVLSSLTQLNSWTIVSDSDPNVPCDQAFPINAVYYAFYDYNTTDVITEETRVLEPGEMVRYCFSGNMNEDWETLNPIDGWGTISSTKETPYGGMFDDSVPMSFNVEDPKVWMHQVSHAYTDARGQSVTPKAEIQRLSNNHGRSGIAVDDLYDKTGVWLSVEQLSALYYYYGIEWRYDNDDSLVELDFRPPEGYEYHNHNIINNPSGGDWHWVNGGGSNGDGTWELLDEWGSENYTLVVGDETRISFPVDLETGARYELYVDYGSTSGGSINGSTYVGIPYGDASSSNWNSRHTIRSSSSSPMSREFTATSNNNYIRVATAASNPNITIRSIKLTKL